MNEFAERDLVWRRSSYCEASACLEIAFDGDDVLIRNTERPDEVIVATRGEWRGLVAGIRDAGDSAR
ncbi:DUF397 domain-containing protein [Actinoplanes sp. L3-i22]|uniref:DUF397 domain-containing protein n=1 Tax=Actinoplanes sp. L3-i22 TaxID=2836373 RepID=UPI001C763DB7|nr:DUF397 domain-containing protein [Actinoplanes sp. L3-i22]BCY12467.1 hypothetical protein L3i22_075550 [Actinoplanes sp. L3-i22]